jgi:predicted 2-oxoglutarate/Fe(II)-dependent dioxygenase YbiX
MVRDAPLRGAPHHDGSVGDPAVRFPQNRAAGDQQSPALSWASLRLVTRGLRVAPFFGLRGMIRDVQDPFRDWAEV